MNTGSGATASSSEPIPCWGLLYVCTYFPTNQKPSLGSPRSFLGDPEEDSREPCGTAGRSDREIRSRGFYRTSLKIWLWVVSYSTSFLLIEWYEYTSTIHARRRLRICSYVLRTVPNCWRCVLTFFLWFLCIVSKFDLIMKLKWLTWWCPSHFCKLMTASLDVTTVLHRDLICRHIQEYR